MTTPTDITRLADVLHATIVYHHHTEPNYQVFDLTFVDPLLKYSMMIRPHAGIIQLAADPDAPISGCPLLEYGFRYDPLDVGDSAYGPGPAIRFYDGPCKRNDIRLTITIRSDGRLYLFANADPTPYPERTGSPGTPPTSHP
ncbi:hypothetical protein Poly51_63960 [Rubripirellula tenax]|uniref:Uncharacterized protein n=1 Tax=Rubripirellula tenax TaxID=2528015 RepID=A0A5C6DUV7_9BACT|nr:hypothetical protein [Rubripirellula tenax]TWU41153.1 hypothetical protein Poly51_63960 [Rubripirellula tenax]